MRIGFYLLVLLCVALAGCGVYSFTGAHIEGKSIYIHPLENRARNVEPSLGPTLTNKIRNRILTQTGLAPLANDNADYDLSANITSYEVTVTATQNTQQALKNRLTISVAVSFKNKLNDKTSFEQSFTRFSDFDASQNLQNVQASLIEDIGNQLADDIFNKAFVNW